MGATNKPTIGMLTASDTEHFRGVLVGVIAAAESLGFRLLMLPLPGTGFADLTPERLARIFPFDGRNLDGLVVAYPLESHQEIALRLHRKYGMPVAVVAREVEGFFNVLPDVHAAFRDAARVLVASGRERVAFIGGAEQHYVTQTRFAGYCAGLRDAGIAFDPRLVVPGSLLFEPYGYESTARLIRTGVPFSALVGANDELAAGAMRALREAGKRVPEDIAVVGFDNNAICSELQPPLCSLSLPAYEMGWTAAAALVNSDPLPDCARIPCPWHLRASAGITHEFLARVLERDRTDYAFELVARPLAEELHRFVHAPPPARVCALADRLVASTRDAGRLLKGLHDLESFLFYQNEGVQPPGRHPAITGLRRLVARLGREPPRESDWDGIERSVGMLALAIAGKQIRRCERFETWQFAGQTLTPFSEIASNLKAEILGVLESFQNLIEDRYLGVFLSEDNTPMTQSSNGRFTLWRPNSSAPRLEIEGALNELRIRDVVPSDDDAWRLSLIPLALGDYVFGFLLFDSDGPHFRYYVELARRVSTALYFSFVNQETRTVQKMESLGELASGIAHDFSNILAAITGHAELIATQAGGPEMAAFHATRIRSATDRATALTQQILQFGRPSPTQMQPIQINDVLEDLRVVLAETFPSTINLRVDVEPTLPPVEADANELHQVFLNVAINARDAMNAEGSLTIRSYLVAGNEMPVNSAPPWPQTYVCVCFADTGCGMDRPTVQRIFEPFFTTKAKGKGTGLGLAVSAKIVRDHRGVIDVRSSPGHGSEFRFFFPAQSEENRST